MRSRVISLLMVFALLTFPLHAKSEFNWGAGVGLQYGGIFVKYWIFQGYISKREELVQA